MPYRYKKRVEGSPYYYVSNKGAGGKTLFRTASDYRYFVAKLRSLAKETETIGVVAYSLTRSGIHIVLQEDQTGTLARFMHRLTVSYATYFNSRYEEKGKLFGGSYNEEQLMTPDDLIVRIGELHSLPKLFAINPETYSWSSYADYIKKQADWLHKTPVFSYFKDDEGSTALRDFTRLLHPQGNYSI